MSSSNTTSRHHRNTSAAPSSSMIMMQGPSATNTSSFHTHALHIMDAFPRASSQPRPYPNQHHQYPNTSTHSRFQLGDEFQFPNQDQDQDQDQAQGQDQDQDQIHVTLERQQSLQDLEERKRVFDRWDSSSRLFRIRSVPFKPVLQPIEEIEDC
eukprot:CAMPEP_0184698898 /NCGR_PEP_ID=MMETSP0313-20130426/5354_1 /TAXON_ID=2792 /ORGANISM="Porphyridium aerugineum, Strain SAG 1380-2" /LENGTH=153 /DNA_ID=CAMNT_0027157899 /DNA_START=46 /DNA_END=507 /DNA_ORIENTATION=-